MFLRMLIPDDPSMVVVSIIIALATVGALVILVWRFFRTISEARKVPGDSTRAEDQLTRTGDLESAVTFRIETLKEFRGRSEAVSADEAAGVLQERDFEAQLAWVRYLVTAVLFLGLMGTVIGLGSTIGTLSPVLQSGQIEQIDDLKKIVEAIGKVVNTMKGAFSCTLDGILASLICSFVAQIVISQYYAKVLRPLDRWCARVLVPYLCRSLEYEHFSEAAKSLRTTVAQSSEILKGQQTLSQQTFDRVGQLINSLEAAGQRAGDQLVKGSRAVQDAGASAGQTILLAGRDLTSGLKDTGEELRRTMANASGNAAESLVAAGSNLEEASGRSSDALQGASHNLFKELERAAGLLADIRPSINEALSSLKTTQLTMTGVVNEMVESLKRLNRELDDAKGLSEASLEGLMKVQATGEQHASASAERLGQLFESHLESLQERDNIESDKRNEITESVAEISKRQLKAIENYGERSHSVLGQILRVQTDHVAEINQISSKQLAAIQQQSRELSEAVAALKTLIEDADYAFRDAKSVAMSQVSDVTPVDGRYSLRPSGAKM